ncbi:hypothetical protein TrVGV298_001917 [Trichoderma virens]|nr:hypothetical protein TrVGV298_001917 [Trichoderma virens]
MPITTILQHQRDRERRDQPGPDLPSTENDSIPSTGDDSIPSMGDDSIPLMGDDSMPSMGDDSMPSTKDDSNTGTQDSIEKVRTDSARGMEQSFGVSLPNTEEKAAEAVRRSVEPNSTHQLKLPNGPKSSRPEVAASSTKRVSAGKNNSKQTITNRPIAIAPRVVIAPLVVPLDGHNTGQMPPANNSSGLASQQIPQSRQISCADNESRQIPYRGHHDDPPSPTVSDYEIARRAFNALQIRNDQGAAPGINNTQQAIPNAHVNEQTAPRVYNTVPTPPTSQSSAETSPSSRSDGQASPAGHYTKYPTPILWNAVQTLETYPNSRNKTEARDRQRNGEVVTRPQSPEEIPGFVRIIERRSSQPSKWQRPQTKSASARRRSMLKHSVTYTLPAADEQTFNFTTSDTPTNSDDSAPGGHCISTVSTAAGSGITKNGNSTATTRKLAMFSPPTQSPPTHNLIIRGLLVHSLLVHSTDAHYLNAHNPTSHSQLIHNQSQLHGSQMIQTQRQIHSQ